MKLLSKNLTADELFSLANTAESTPSTAESPTKLSSDGPTLLERAVALALASGLNEEQAASLTNVSVANFRDLASRPVVADLVNKAQAALTLSPEQRIARAIPAVIDKKLRALHTSKDDKLVSAIGTELLDRHFGKPVQTVNSFGATIQATTSVEELDARLAAINNRLKVLDSAKSKMKNGSILVEASVP